MADVNVKTLQTRISLKYDTYTNWTKTDVADQGGNLVLLKGEIGICEIPVTNTDSNVAPTVLFKVGDGTKKFSELPWASAKAADVYQWAKASDVVVDGKTIKFVGGAIDSDGNKTNKVITLNFATPEEVETVRSGLDARITAIEGSVGTGKVAEDIADLQTRMGDAEQDIVDLGNDKLDKSTYETYISGKSMSDADLKKYAEDEADAAETAAKTYAEGQAASVKTYVDGTFKTAVEGYADGKASAAESAAKAYADGKDTAIAAAKKAGDDAQDTIDSYIESNNAVVAGKADKATVEAMYTNDQIDGLLDGKVDNATYATDKDTFALKSEITTLADKADKSYVDTELGKKVNVSDYNADKATFATKTELKDHSDAQTEINNDFEDRISDLEGINHEQLAKDAAASAVATIRDDAPEAFDTLKEIATWISNNESATSAADLVNRVGALEKIDHDAYIAADTALKSELEGKITAIDNHSHANKTVLDGITAQNITDWNDAVSKEHEHSNKALLDTYTQTEADLADAVAKKHSHTFVESELNNIKAGDVARWNAEIGAKELAASKTTTAEVKTQIEAYGYATEDYVDQAEADAKAYTDEKIADLGALATKDSIDKITTDDQYYGAELSVTYGDDSTDRRGYLELEDKAHSGERVLLDTAGKISIYTGSNPGNPTGLIKEGTIATTSDVSDAVSSAVSGINTKIGTVAENKTVVGLIGEAQSAAEANAATTAQGKVDALANGQVATNKTNIESLDSRVEAIENDYLKVADLFIIDCGTSTTVIHKN